MSAATPAPLPGLLSLDFSPDISYTWTLTVCGLLCLTSLTQRSVFKLHSCCVLCWGFIPSCACIVLILWRHRILVTCSSADRHLGCFHFSAIVNSASVNVTYKSLCEHVFSFLLGTNVHT